MLQLDSGNTVVHMALADVSNAAPLVFHVWPGCDNRFVGLR